MVAPDGHPRSRTARRVGLRHGAAGRGLPLAGALAARWPAHTLPLSPRPPACPSRSPPILAAVWAPVGAARTVSQGAASMRGIGPTDICRPRTGGLRNPRRGATPSHAPQPRVPGPGTPAVARSSSPRRGTRRPGRSTRSRSGCPAGVHGPNPRLQCRVAREVVTGPSRAGHLIAATHRGVHTRSAGAGGVLTGIDEASPGGATRLLDGPLRGLRFATR